MNAKETRYLPRMSVLDELTFRKDNELEEQILSTGRPSVSLHPMRSELSESQQNLEI